jgi:hypothetical protein
MVSRTGWKRKEYIVINDVKARMSLERMIRLDFNKHFLIETNSGKKLHVFLQGLTILYYCYDNSNKPTAARKVIDDPVIDYDIKIAADGNLHLICLTADGGFKYYYGKIGEKLLGTYLALIDLKNTLIQNLSLIIAGNNIHIFRTITTPDNPAFSKIIHSIWNGCEWREHFLGKITTTDNTPSIVIDKDRQDNVHLWYSSMVRYGYCQTFYKRFNSTYLIWSETENLDLSENTEKIYALIDPNDTLHFLSSNLNQNTSQLQYRRLQNATRSNNNWGLPHVLTSSLDANCRPFIVFNKQAICVVWVENKRFYKSVSIDSGVSWGKPEIIETSGNTTIVPYLYNNPADYKHIKAPYTLGITEPELSVMLENLTDIPAHEEPRAPELPLPAEQEVKVIDNEVVLLNVMESIANMVGELQNNYQKLTEKNEKTNELVKSFLKKIEDIETKQSEIFNLLNKYQIELTELSNQIEKQKALGIFGKLFS